MPKKFYNAATSTGFSTLDMGVLLYRKTVYLKLKNSALTIFRLYHSFSQGILTEGPGSVQLISSYKLIQNIVFN